MNKERMKECVRDIRLCAPHRSNSKAHEAADLLESLRNELGDAPDDEESLIAIAVGLPGARKATMTRMVTKANRDYYVLKCAQLIADNNEHTESRAACAQYARVLEKRCDRFLKELAAAQQRITGLEQICSEYAESKAALSKLSQSVGNPVLELDDNYFSIALVDYVIDKLSAAQQRIEALEITNQLLQARNSKPTARYSCPIEWCPGDHPNRDVTCISMKEQPRPPVMTDELFINSINFECAIGGEYRMPDGRSFWMDAAVVKEIVRRVKAARKLLCGE